MQIMPGRSGPSSPLLTRSGGVMTEAKGLKLQQEPLTLMGVHRSPKGYALRDFLHRSNVPFIWAELASDAEAREKAQVSGLSDRRLPICIFPDGERMESPTIRQ